MKFSYLQVFIKYRAEQLKAQKIHLNCNSFKEPVLKRYYILAFFYRIHKYLQYLTISIVLRKNLSLYIP